MSRNMHFDRQKSARGNILTFYMSVSNIRRFQNFQLSGPLGTAEGTDLKPVFCIVLRFLMPYFYIYFITLKQTGPHKLLPVSVRTLSFLINCSPDIIKCSCTHPNWRMFRSWNCRSSTPTNRRGRGVIIRNKKCTKLQNYGTEDYPNDCRSRAVNSQKFKWVYMRLGWLQNESIFYVKVVIRIQPNGLYHPLYHTRPGKSSRCCMDPEYL